VLALVPTVDPAGARALGGKKMELDFSNPSS
jgi:hypothetical protein